MNRAFENSWRTAIARTKASAPARYLIKKGLISGHVLDYGCGRGTDADHFGWDMWDPHWCDEIMLPPYDTILCSYVLNVLPKNHETRLLDNIKSLLGPAGNAYITVRRNVKKPGYTSTGTYQRNVRLKLPVVTENSDYCIYRLTA